MPGAAIGIGVGLRERRVDSPPLGRVGAVIRGGAHEWMAKLEPVGVDREQAERLDLAEILLREPERFERAEHDAGCP